MSNLLLKRITNNLGKLQIDEDKIICYVNNKKLIEYLEKHKELFYRNLILNSSKKISKPICFVIEDYRFDFGLKIKSDSNISIIFRKCSFFDQIYIEEAQDIIFERNKYFCDNCIFTYGNYFLCGRIKNLKFINNNFCNRSKPKEMSFFGMRLEVNNLEIKNSYTNLTEYDRDMVIYANNINIYDSTINSHFPIKIETDKLDINNSKINSDSKIILNDKNSKNNNIVMGLKAPKVIYNDVDLSRNDEISCNLDKEELRNTLIGQLKILKDKALKINQDRLNEYKNKIDNDSIVKVIKNK